jgi:hypothetical protein
MICVRCRLRSERIWAWCGHPSAPGAGTSLRLLGWRIAKRPFPSSSPPMNRRRGNKATIKLFGAGANASSSAIAGVSFLSSRSSRSYAQCLQVDLIEIAPKSLHLQTRRLLGRLCARRRPRPRAVPQGRQLSRSPKAGGARVLATSSESEGEAAPSPGGGAA